MMPTPQEATALAGAELIDEFRALLLRCAEALERQAEAAEIQTLTLSGHESRATADVIQAYCERVSGELADAYEPEEGGDQE